MQRRQALAAMAGTATLAAGCTLAPGQDHAGPDAPLAAPLPPWPRPRVRAWVLGSGGPRGFVHVGVVKALQELKLVPDLIVGASAGAVVGVLCAAGWTAARLEQRALDLGAMDLLRWNPLGSTRFSGNAIAELVDRELHQRRLQDLPMRVACAVQRLRDGQVLAFTRGHAGLAVQASAAIEGQLAPVVVRGEAYADADLRMPLPVRLARSLGATQVLAVDASAHEDRAPPGAERWRDSDRRKRELTAPDAAAADLVLHPDIGYWAGYARDYRLRVIEAGYRQTLAQAGALRALHAG